MLFVFRGKLAARQGIDPDDGTVGGKLPRLTVTVPLTPPTAGKSSGRGMVNTICQVRVLLSLLPVCSLYS
ncbi:hypothetical protein, partial [Enterobacter hormaechei]|uniref:hypothetical protein n=1 Tax=Enterobacter hormaechei TaxID=158836 RepID=UPI00197AB1C9